MPVIQLPTPLRPYTEGHREVSVDADSVGAALDALVERYSGLARHLRDEQGQLRSFVNVYLGDEDVRFLDGPATALSASDTLLIVPSIAGGLDEEDLPELDHAEIRRYSRHLILEEVGLVGQRRLKKSAVLCVGTGGLGSPLLLYLAAAGVGRIGIIDFDVVDESNLQRQIIHGTCSVGRSKVHSAADRIRDINPHVQLDLFEEALTAENALKILEPYDVVVDGTDNFPTRYLVNDACVLLGKPNVYGSIFKFEGQVSVFNYQGGPNYRDLYPEAPPPGLVPSCAEGGVLGILPGVVGALQATETLKLLLGRGTSLSGRLLLYDALEMRFRELKLRRDPHAEPITALREEGWACAIAEPEAAAEAFERIQVQEVAARREAGWTPYVLDVRRRHETEIVQIGFADRLEPHDTVSDIAAQLPRDRDILIHCKSGGRSAKAAADLAALGFTRLFNLEGGLLAWAREVDRSLATY